MTVTDTRIAATPPTLADVAELAGVSSATASRVLTGSAKVSPQTRDRVEEAMARLGYVRNRAPRASQPRRAGSIALVVGEESVKVFADPFFARMLRSVSNSLVAADLQLILLTLHSPREYRTVSRYLRSGHVDGALFVSMHGRPDFDYASLGVPIVLCGRPFSGGEKLSYVDADNVSGAWKAVKYLLDNGRRAIATIAGPPDMAPGIDRLLGYRKAMTAADAADPGMIAYGDFQSASGEHALFRLIDHRPAIDAVFAASDLMAAGALRALRRPRPPRPRRCGRHRLRRFAVGSAGQAEAHHGPPAGRRDGRPHGRRTARPDRQPGTPAVPHSPRHGASPSRFRLTLLNRGGPPLDLPTVGLSPRPRVSTPDRGSQPPTAGLNPRPRVSTPDRGSRGLVVAPLAHRSPDWAPNASVDTTRAPLLARDRDTLPCCGMLARRCLLVTPAGNGGPIRLL